MPTLFELWRRAWSPSVGFRQRAEEAPLLGASLWALMVYRSPLALVEVVLTYWSLRSAFTSLRGLEAGTADWIKLLPVALTPEDWRMLVEGLPTLPAISRVLPWLVLLAPIWVLGLWLHDAAWDHGCLWMFGGLKARRGLRATLVAEAEALTVGSLGAAAGLLGSLPGVGWVLSLPLAAVAVWFWVLRGFALAAWHRCPVWKGIAATVLHALLGVCCVGALLGGCMVFLVTVLG